MTENIFFVAQAAEQQQTSSGSFLSIVPMLLIMGLFVYFMFRSQRKQARERQNMMDSIKAGDKIVTTGGIVGTVTAVNDNIFVVKIADNVKIEVVKAGVASVEKAADAQAKTKETK